MTEPRLAISPKLAAHMAYPKFTRAPTRVLILESNYWIDQACARAAERMGWEVAKARVAMEGHMSRDMLQSLFETLVHTQPDFVLSVNLSGMDNGGIIARFLADLELPHATWFVDDPRTILMRRTTYASDFAVAFTWEPAYADYLRQCGFAAVHTLPLAADDTLFRHAPTDTHIHPPTFVASSMTDYSAREWENVRANPALCRAVEQAFESGRVNRVQFGEGVESVLRETTQPFDAEELRRAELIFFIEGTRRLRHDLVAALAPEGLHVRGDTHWQQVTDNHGPNVPYETDLPAFYRDCPVNLNSTSIQMATAVNQRVFDCPAAGGFLLTDNQASLTDLFDADTETARYNTLEEARDQLRWFMAHPKARHEITKRAQRRIFGEHTYQNRLEIMEGLLRERFGGIASHQ